MDFESASEKEEDSHYFAVNLDKQERNSCKHIRCNVCEQTVILISSELFFAQAKDLIDENNVSLIDLLPTRQ